HLHGRDRRHGLDARDVALRQLPPEGENGVELPWQMLDSLLGDGDACEVRDTADGGGVDGHRDAPATGYDRPACREPIAKRRLPQQPRTTAVLRSGREKPI